MSHKRATDEQMTLDWFWAKSLKWVQNLSNRISGEIFQYHIEQICESCCIRVLIRRSYIPDGEKVNMTWLCLDACRKMGKEGSQFFFAILKTSRNVCVLQLGANKNWNAGSLLKLMYSSWTIPVSQTKHLKYTAAKLINGWGKNGSSLRKSFLSFFDLFFQLSSWCN